LLIRRGERDGQRPIAPPKSYSETWQLVVNTGTTIITFLMVFLIQQNQNKDSRASLNQPCPAMLRCAKSVRGAQRLAPL
jgi:hypothetical protein